MVIWTAVIFYHVFQPGYLKYHQKSGIHEHKYLENWNANISVFQSWKEKKKKKGRKEKEKKANTGQQQRRKTQQQQQNNPKLTISLASDFSF